MLLTGETRRWKSHSAVWAKGWRSLPTAAEDDDGLGWSTLADAIDASRVLPGAMLVAGNRSGRAVVRVVTVDEDGQVHFSVLPGSLEKSRHLLDHTVA